PVEDDLCDGAVAQIVLNRPQKLNALNAQMLTEFSTAIAELGKDPSVSVIVISGAGNNFSVGYDVDRADDGYSGAVDAHGTWDDWESLREKNLRWLSIWDTPKPVISAIEGYCMGGATQMSVCTDITVVSEQAVIGWPSIPLGGGLLSPPTAWLVGPKKAKELSFIAGSRMSGIEAHQLGWANYAVTPGTAVERALEIAGEVARTPLDLLRLKKLALNRQFDLQGFRETFLAGAEWDALAHTAAGTHRMVDKVNELGLKGAIQWFRSEDNQ
ncbi:MAG: enoyl-CoA hydratase/isomerase family protein, partial [Microbacterium sp.]